MFSGSIHANLLSHSFCWSEIHQLQQFLCCGSGTAGTHQENLGQNLVADSLGWLQEFMCLWMLDSGSTSVLAVDSGYSNLLETAILQFLCCLMFLSLDSQSQQWQVKSLSFKSLWPLSSFHHNLSCFFPCISLGDST
jgi:hypothetical protein